ncbi:hypothetical protein EV121DRAFT_215725 [Schizophyllum commune]
MLSLGRYLSTTARRCLSTTARSTQTTVAKGTAFEQRSLAVARKRLSMSLRRVGGKSDGGIDLTGWWWLPHASDALQSQHTSDTAQSRHAADGDASRPQPHPRRRIRVLAQCKAEKKKIGPNYVREMEGVLYQYRGVPRHHMTSSLADSLHASQENTDDEANDASLGHPIVALFISESPFTKSTMLRALSSTVPFLLLHLPPTQPRHPLPSSSSSCSTSLTSSYDDTTTMGSILMNHALSRMLGGDLEVRWERNLSDGRQSTDGTWTPGGRPGLYWKGQKLEPWTQDGDGYDDPASL